MMFFTAATVSGHSGGLFGRIGDRQLGKHGFAAGIGDLASHPDGNPVVVGIGNGHGRADRVAVPAVHALLVVDA